MRLARACRRLIGVARSRSVVVAGAGIGGLTASLALARAGFRVVVLDQAERLEEAGAGIQLSPNATAILTALGLADGLKSRVVAPEAIHILRCRDASTIVRVPLGDDARAAPYWVIHRADLQSALLEALAGVPDIELVLGHKVEDVAVHRNGITAVARSRAGMRDEHGIALVGADGIWSTVRGTLGLIRPPSFGHRTAWRAVVPIDRVPAPCREPSTFLWLGPDAHLVHYPVKAGTALNIVAIVRDEFAQPGWSAPAARADLLARFSTWASTARALLAVPDRWVKWALFDRPPTWRWGKGPVTLLGDAAHPMLPFLAQGGAMAIEDAAALARCLEGVTDAPDAALRRYERLRRRRTARVQRQARQNGVVYHLRGPTALARDLALKAMGGRGLLAHYDWLYDWRTA
jgi:salicylate hydroxylase